MSEAPSGRQWRFYTDDMLGFVEPVLDHTGGVDQAGFEGIAITFDEVRPCATVNSSG